jgi:hypothetical protein
MMRWGVLLSKPGGELQLRAGRRFKIDPTSIQSTSVSKSNPETRDRLELTCETDSMSISGSRTIELLQQATECYCRAVDSRTRYNESLPDERPAKRMTNQWSYIQRSGIQAYTLISFDNFWFRDAESILMTPNGFQERSCSYNKKMFYGQCRVHLQFLLSRKMSFRSLLLGPRKYITRAE